MRIFKFGGASVKDAEGVRNVVNVIQQEGVENTLVVISAMGKMTNAFEDVVKKYYYQDNKLTEAISFVKEYHQTILNDLFDNTTSVFNDVESLFNDLEKFLEKNTSQDYNYIYDQIVCFGELLSTTIVSNYLTSINVKNTWLDVRNYIKTDSNYRDAKVNWELTQDIIQQKIETKNLNITQGFLGGNTNNQTTTLGREGSDYTAGIFAYCLDAKSVTIWKDVDGVLNADPRVFSKTELLQNISYTEAIEMAFYGASVIHPKTIQPLEQLNIPLYVRSFKDLNKTGTCVSSTQGIEPLVPCFIVKKNQILISIAAKDFSFMVEDNISTIFKALHEYKLKVNLIQNSAISFSVCVEDKFNNFAAFCKELQASFNIKTYQNVSLFTIRHFDEKSLEMINKRGKSILKQINTNTAQLVIQETM